MIINSFEFFIGGNNNSGNFQNGSSKQQNKYLNSLYAFIETIFERTQARTQKLLSICRFIYRTRRLSKTLSRRIEKWPKKKVSIIAGKLAAVS